MSFIEPMIRILLALLLAPLALGLINKTKAFFAGRVGPPILQLYFDLLKLRKKSSVYSRTTTWIFRTGPLINFLATMAALTMVPMGKHPALVSFSGDFILVVYLLGLGRFFTVLGALDTGSSFEGMGASREVKFSALAEPALLLAIAALLRLAPESSLPSLSQVSHTLSGYNWISAFPVLCLVAAALFIVLLAENARIPFDDPNTHLELTMIHEVMVLDYSGVDLGIILYTASLKLWLMGSILVGIIIPYAIGNSACEWMIYVAAMALLTVAIGVFESRMARLRLVNASHLLAGATALAALALLLSFPGMLR